MNEITEPIRVKLEAFDKEGIHCGYGVLRSDGRWDVYSIHGGFLGFYQNINEAKSALRRQGAWKIREE